MLELVIALIPDADTTRIVETYNASAAALWVANDPITYTDLAGDPNSLPHLSLLHMFVHRRYMAELTHCAHNLVAYARRNGLLPLQLKLTHTEMSFGFWFWAPDDDWTQGLLSEDPTLQARTKRWFCFQQLILDGVDGKYPGLPSLRARDHTRYSYMTTKQLDNLERWGYAYVGQPHITLAHLGDNTGPTEEIQHLCTFDALVIGHRGPRGTICREIARIPFASRT